MLFVMVIRKKNFICDGNQKKYVICDGDKNKLFLMVIRKNDRTRMFTLRAVSFKLFYICLVNVVFYYWIYAWINKYVFTQSIIQTMLVFIGLAPNVVFCSAIWLNYPYVWHIFSKEFTTSENYLKIYLYINIYKLLKLQTRNLE